jgi:hypothetical protein
LVFDENLSRVRGTLKPDSSQRKLEFALSLQNKLEGETVIALGANSPKQGGAIFSFRYTYAGREELRSCIINYNGHLGSGPIN